MKFIDDAIKESEQRMEEKETSNLVSDIDKELGDIINGIKTNIFVIGAGGAGNNTITRLNEMGYETVNAEGAFYVFPKIEDEDFVTKAAKAGVITVPGEAFGLNGKGHVRMSYANSYENIEKALNKVVSAKNSDEAVSMMKGKKGTEVELTIKRGEQILDVKVTRDKIVSKTVDEKVLEEQKIAQEQKESDPQQGLIAMIAGVILLSFL